ncbi:MAG: restriction endonuclease [Betaproteobacteria bacterium]|nr:restriction endonuclease [Betaproteobacteria bacterium]
MKLTLPENSLFAILLRSRWWVSLLVALGAFAVVRLFLDAVFAFFAALPFIVIAVMAWWKQRGVPSGARLEAAIDTLRAMTWEEFARALEQGYRREGYTVKRVEGAADFELEKAGRLSLVAAKRWKASRTGVEPLKELAAAGEARGAAECVYVLAGEMTQNAQGFAEKTNIKWVRSADLVKLTAG